MTSITGANAVFMLAVPPLFPVPIRLQGFATDDVFDTDTIEPTETQMGVDGKLSGGFVNVPVPMVIALQADSASNLIFDTWNATQKQLQDIFVAQGVVLLTATGKKFTLTNGFLTQYKPIPDTKKLLQSQRHRITWESIFPAIA